MQPVVGKVLLRYQAKVVADAIDPNQQFIVIEKSRRIGVTWALASAGVLIAGRAEQPQDVWYLGYKESLALEFVNEAAGWSRRFQRALWFRRGYARIVAKAAVNDSGSRPLPKVVDEDGNRLDVAEDVYAYDHKVLKLDDVENRDGAIYEESGILAFRVKFNSGKRVSALTSAPSNLRGLQGTAVIDEAAFHGQLAELLKAALAFLVWGGKVIVVSTHDGVDNPFNALCEEIKAAKRPGTHHFIPLRSALDDGLYPRICLVRGREWSQEGEDEWVRSLYEFYGEGASEELDCIPAKQASAYIAPALVESCMYGYEESDPRIIRLTFDDDFALLPQEERTAVVAEWCEVELTHHLERLPRDRTHYLGEDFGRVSDLSVFAPITLQQDLTRHFPFLLELHRVPHQQQFEVLKYVCDRLPRLDGVWMDAGGNGSWLAEAAADEYGSSIVEQVKITAPWYAEHLPPLKAALQDRLLSVPRDASVRADLTSFRLENGQPRLPHVRQKGSDGVKRHGDAAIAIVMAYAASRGDAGEYWEALSNVQGQRGLGALMVGGRR